MRTTLTIDDDLAAILYRESRRKGLSFKALVNATLRRGLSHEQVTPPVQKAITKPHAFGFKTGVDLDKLNQLADQLEAEAFSAKYQTQR